MNTPQKKTIAAKSLKVDYSLNIRDQSNYDLATIMEQIRQHGRVLKPLAIRGEDNMVLQGNRRLRGVLALLDDPTTPQELKDAISKLDCLVYTGLSESETLSLIIDHGSEKPISRSEVVEAAWRLDRQFFSEEQIIGLLYYALAKFTGNERKLNEIPKQGKERTQALRKWFHGTVGNFMLAAAKMGEFVRQQFLLTHKSEDKLLRPEGKAVGPDGTEVTVPAEVVRMRCSRDRIAQLSAAKSADQKDAGWTVEHGGKAFNALIEKFCREDAGDEETPKVTRPSVKDLIEKSDQFSSRAIRNALLVAAGDQEAGRGLVEIDDQLKRLGMVMDTLRAKGPEVQDPAVRALLAAICDDSLPAGEVDVRLAPLTKAPVA